MKNGFEVAVYARRPEAAEKLVAAGAAFCDSIAACAAGRDAVITMVGFPKDVEQVYLGDGGILAHADKGTILIDMTTTSPKLSMRIAAAAEEKGLLRWMLRSRRRRGRPGGDALHHGGRGCGSV